MARKLKSDKVLFLATLLLALASIVMVYSASAAIAEQRFHSPYLFLVKQSMWVGMGMAMLGLVMRVDYRAWKQPVLIWSALGIVLDLRWWPSSSARRSTARAAGSGSAASACSRRSWRSWPSIFFTAALLERRMHRIDEPRYSLLPVGLVIGAVTDARAARARLRHRGVDCARRRGDGVRRRAELEVRRVHRSASLAPPTIYVLLSADYRVKRLTSFMCPECDPMGAGFQLLQSLIAVGTRRRLGERADGRRAEALLSARAAHRLHLRGDRRGARPGGRPR